MSAQFLLVWVSVSWTSSHWNQVSYLNKHTNIVLKERKLGEAYLFRIILFYLLKGNCWTLPCPHLILPTVELARDVGACPLPQVTDSLSSHQPTALGGVRMCALVLWEHGSQPRSVIHAVSLQLGFPT